MHQTQTTIDFEQESNYVFKAIQRYTLYLKRQTLKSVGRWLKAPELIGPASENSVELIPQDLEQYAPMWQQLIPDNLFVRMSVAYKISQSYSLLYSDMPRIRQALQLDSLNKSFKAWYQTDFEDIFKSAPAVQVLNPSAALLQAFGWKRCERNQTLFSQGETGESLYIVLHGRLRVEINGQIVEWIGQGEVVGELALLTYEPRSATIVAARDSLLLELSKADFESLLQAYPDMMLPILKLVAGRLRNTRDPYKRPSSIKTIAVIPLHGESDIALQLARTLNRSTKTLYLTRYNLNSLIFKDGDIALTNPHDDDLVVSWLNEQESSHDFIIYEGHSKPDEWTRRCLLQADYVLLIADATSDPSITPVEKELLADIPLYDLILTHPTREISVNTRIWQAERRIGKLYHTVRSTPDIIPRIARRVAGRSVGAVFGGGGARCFAHVGMIKAMQELGIPIDVIGGTSGGAIIGLACAMGYSPEEILKEGRKLFDKVLDYTLPLISLASGKRLNNALSAQFGDIAIEDLWTEFFCVSANITRAQLEIHQSGLVRYALRATSSLPGVFPPVVAQSSKSELLVDGGILNNIPVDVMVQRGADIIFTGDVFHGEVPLEEYELDESLSGFAYLANRFNPFRKRVYKAPGMLSTLVKISSLGSRSERELRRKLSNVYITPALDKFGMFDVEKAQEMAQIGYESAKIALKAWIDEHPHFRSDLFCD